MLRRNWRIRVYLRPVWPTVRRPEQADVFLAGVVDTGIHAQGWSREQAIEFMAANASLSMHDIETEVDRYFCWPGQALAYKIGELQISQLRREAQEQLGDRFDLRAFHDALLSEGAMPIDILEKRMRDWITSRGG